MRRSARVFRMVGLAGRPARVLCAACAIVVCAVLAPVAAAAPPAAAGPAGYPYTLLDPGTFGGPSSYLGLPGVPLTSGGTLLGSADTGTLDSGYLSCPESLCDGYRQHAFAWRDGKLADLGVPSGMTGSFIDQLNGEGVGAGGAETSQTANSPVGDVAVLFSRGQAISLGTLPGGSNAFAQNIDGQGQVAGDSSNGVPDPFSFFGWGTETRSFVWRDGVMRDLGSLGGPDTVMNWQNDRGQIVGLSNTNDTPDPANSGFPGFDPFLWQNGQMTDLGSLGGTLGTANWINDRGQIVGQSDLVGDQNAHPFLWQNGKMVDLGTPGGGFGFASDINQRGDTAGAYLAADGNFHGILWRGRRMVDLPPVGGAAQAFGNAVNDRDQVIGNQDDANFNEISAVLWTGGRGYDLSTLVAPNPLQMTSADYIDDHGDIVGHGFLPDGSQRVFLLIRNPTVPLPAAIASAARDRHLQRVRDHRLSPGRARELMREFGPGGRRWRRPAL